MSSDCDESWCAKLKQKTAYWNAQFINPNSFRLSGSGDSKFSLFFSLVYWASKLLGLKSNFNFSTFLLLKKQIIKKIAHSNEILEFCKPDYLLVFEDGIAGPLELIFAAKKKNIVVTVCPYEISQRKDLENVIHRNRNNNTEYFPPTRLIGKYFKWSAKEWIFQDYLGKSLLIPSELILARKYTGVEPTNPWAINGGQADFVAAESKNCFDIYTDNGISPQKLTIVGSPYADKLFDLKKEKTNRLTKQSLVLISLPPNFDDYYDNNYCGSYFKMLQMLTTQIGLYPNLSALVSIHPATLDRDRKEILSFDWKISEKPILEDLYQSDICISVFSSTIRWFLASSIPVINLDIWNFELELYSKSTGFLNCKNEAGFMNNLSKLSSQKKLAQLRKEMTKVASDWGIIDGEATSRLLETLRSRKLELK